LEKEVLITKLGWPVAQPRLTKRPEASSVIRLPLGSTYWSTWGLMLIFRISGCFSSHATWISQSKWPMLQRMTSSFIWSMCSERTMSAQPVAVTTMSAWGAAVSMVTTWKPSIAAWSAQIGSISVIITRAPMFRSEWALPLPTSP
jgi:hypothetical protein